MKPWVAIVLAVVIGAAVTWLWHNRESAPAISTARPQNVAPQTPVPPPEPRNSGSQPTTPSDASSAPSKSSPATAAPVEASAPPADDSTYYRMLAVAQSLPKMADAARRVAELHDNFLLTPDDPVWGRRTEQTLRDYFRAQSTESGFEVTSISCRSEGCEVQALGKPLPRLDDPASPSEEASAVVKGPLAPFLADYPTGPSLRKGTIAMLDLGDRSGVFITYERMDSRTEGHQ